MAIGFRVMIMKMAFSSNSIFGGGLNKTPFLMAKVAIGAACPCGMAESWMVV